MLIKEIPKRFLELVIGGISVAQALEQVERKQKKSRTNNLKKQIKACDYFMGCTFTFMIVIRFLTIGYLSKIAEVSGATIEQVATLYEMDIVAKIFINLQQFSGLLLFFILPAMAMALYLYFRRKTLQGLFDLNTLYFFVTFAFFTFLLNIVNDLAAYLGRII